MMKQHSNKMICTCKYTKICNINELCKLFYAGIPNA